MLLPFQLYDTNVNLLSQADATLVVPSQPAEDANSSVSLSLNVMSGN